MKMNKIITMLLVGTLAASMGMMALASEASDKMPKEDTKEIKATYNGDVPTPEIVYYVDVEWGSLEYTYSSGVGKKWNPELLVFEETTGEPAWTCEPGANEIKVTNHSNTVVAVSLSYDKTESTVDGTFTQDTVTLSSAGENTEYASGDSETVTLNLDGNLAESATDKTKVGTVNVTVKEKIGGFAVNTDTTNYIVGPIESTAEEGVYTVTVISTDGKTHSAGYNVEIEGIRYYVDGTGKKLTTDVSSAAINYLLPRKGPLTITFDTNNMTCKLTYVPD